MGVVLALLFLFGVFSPSEASTGFHSLQYFYMGVSSPGLGVPEFYVAGYVDEKQISWYDSMSQQDESRAWWMEENEGSEYWKGQTWFSRDAQQVFKQSIQTLMERFNQSEGVHTFQGTYGCELDRDGNTWWFYQFAYDGHDFIILDKETLTWVAVMPEADITERNWNANSNFAQVWQGYLDQTCIEWLKKYLQYGVKMLDSEVQPNVTVWARKSEGHPVTLHCLVTGFYPREIEVKWMKNGNITMQGMAAKNILPNHDGTYQIRESLEIDPQEKVPYSCHVDHSSLPQPYIVYWGSHSLRYFHVGASDPAPGSPEFYTVGYVNEIPYDWYDIQSEAKGMSKVNTEDLQYWEQNTQIYRGWQQGFNGDNEVTDGALQPECSYLRRHSTLSEEGKANCSPSTFFFAVPV